MPGCAVKPGEVVVVGQDSRVADCTVEQGAKLRFLLEPEEAKEPSRGVTEPPTVSPPPTPAPIPKRTRMDPVVPTPSVAEPVAAPTPPVVETTARTEQPAAPTPGDLGALAQQGGGGMTGVILAIVAVVGGGAAWKFYSQRSEQQYELAKEKMKMDAAAQGMNGAQPPPCQAATTTLEQKIAALNTRIDAAEAKAEAASKKSSSFSADFDGEALERSVKRLQKQVKELQEDKA